MTRGALAVKLWWRLIAADPTTTADLHLACELAGQGATVAECYDYLRYRWRVADHHRHTNEAMMCKRCGLLRNFDGMVPSRGMCKSCRRKELQAQEAC